MLRFAGINIPFSTIENIKTRGPVNKIEEILLRGVSLGNPEPEWPIYQASGYGEVFMYDNLSRLRWIPNYETLTLYGYTGAEKKIVPISWFYDKPIGESIVDTKTGRTYPAESTPNYEAYRKQIPTKVVPTPTPVLYKCPTCGEVFSSEEELVQHIKEAHKPYVPPAPEPTPKAPKWPVIQAEGYGETFMVVEEKTLRWFEGWTIFKLYGYEAADIQKVPLSWFYGKTIGASVPVDSRTIPKEAIPNYAMYVRATQTIEEEKTPISPPLPLRTISCQQCKSTLQIVSPSPETMVTQASTWLTCPVCGYPELVQVPTGGFTVKVMVRKPWPPVAELPRVIPIVEPPLGAVTWHDITCSNCGSLLQYSTQAIAPEYFRDVVCPVCGTSLGVKGLGVRIIEKKISITPRVIPDWLIKQINDALDQYEEKIIELEEALRTAQAAEFYNNPYGIIEAHAQTLLNQLNRYKPTVEWPLELSTRWSELFSRLQKLIIDARTAAKERKPIPTYEEATEEQQNQWITDTILELQQQGLPWSSLPVSYAQPGEIAINGRAILPTEGEISPVFETYTEFPVAFPDYSVEERIQEASGQEPWELAEAVTPAPPKKITPYLILAGLGITTLAVWYYKKKKRAR